MLDQELRRLPERYRAPLVLCYLRGRTHEQAAEDLRCPVGTVRSRLARGRDLLRKRLTRRGFGLSGFSAFLGGDATLPVRLLVVPVPPPMAAATVRAALAFGSPSILKAGAAAASSVVLAQGVLTTMKIAQFQWLGLAAVVAGLSTVGGVAVVGGAPAQRPGAARVEASAPLPSPEEPQNKVVYLPAPLTDKERQELLEKVVALTKDNDLKTTEIANLNDRLRQMREDGSKDQNRDRPGEPSDARLKLLEEKIDRLLTRSGATTALDPIAVLEPQLDQAILKYNYTNTLAKRNAVSQNELALYREIVLSVVARIEASDQEIRDELDRLLLERRRKEAQAERAAADVEAAKAVVARHSMLNARNPNVVAAEEAAKAQGEHKAAAASHKVALVEVEEVNLRIEQFKRKRDQSKELVKRAKQAKELK